MFAGLGEVLNPDNAVKSDFEKQKEDSTKILEVIKKISGIKGKKVMTPQQVALMIRSTK